MDKDNYFSSAIVTFPSEGDYKLWSDSFKFSCIRIADENLVKILIIWEYEDEEAFVRCQKLWSKWGDIAQEFVSKIVFNRGKKFYSW